MGVASFPSVQALLASVAECNSPLSERDALVPFHVDGATLGYCTPAWMELLCTSFPTVFQRRDSLFGLAPSLSTCEARTAAVGECMGKLRAAGQLTGWREELLPVSRAWDEAPAFLLERAAVPRFGVKAYGVHVNVFVRNADGSINLWLARRSRSKSTWPGMLDHAVAGGQPHGILPSENVVKEAAEEAGIVPVLARQAKAVGAVSYAVSIAEGWKRDVLFCYDLEVPSDFIPVAVDGEVESFACLPLADSLQRLSDYKPNCRLVVLDFAVRHGALTPDMPGYCALLRSLRSEMS
jgi:isopentenyldiphosphate isomerase